MHHGKEPVIITSYKNGNGGNVISMYWITNGNFYSIVQHSGTEQKNLLHTYPNHFPTTQSVFIKFGH